MTLDFFYNYGNAIVKQKYDMIKDDILSALFYGVSQWHLYRSTLPKFKLCMKGLLENFDIENSQFITRVHSAVIVQNKIIVRFTNAFCFDAIFDLKDFTIFYVERTKDIFYGNTILDEMVEHWYYKTMNDFPNCKLKKSDMYDENLPYERRLNAVITLYLLCTSRKRKWLGQTGAIGEINQIICEEERERREKIEKAKREATKKLDFLFSAHNEYFRETELSKTPFFKNH